MERLTTKNKQFNDYCVAENLRQLDVRDYLYSINQKMGKYEDLEEKIGCPLEVLFRALKDGIYSKDFREDITQGAVLMFCGDYGWILQTYSCDEFTKNYKKTWWLKADKSE